MRYSDWEQHEMDVKSGEEMDCWMDAHPKNPANLPDPTNREQERREDEFAFEQFRDRR